MPRRLTTEQFANNAIALHGDSFDYSAANYTNSQSKITIKCNTCGTTFEQLPNAHLRKGSRGGCPKCQAGFVSEANRITHDQFVEKAIALHGDLYSYSLVEYKTGKDKIMIICNTCGTTFEQRASAHIRKVGRGGCPSCRYKRIAEHSTITKDEFVRRSIAKHGDLYSYHLVEYVNIETKVIIFCRSCNKTFSKRPGDHLSIKQMGGCPICGRKKINRWKTLDSSSFAIKAREIHGDLYSYHLVEYVNNKTKVTIVCRSCGLEFSQQPSAHLLGQGCPNCIYKGQKALGELLLSMFKRVARQAPAKIGGKIHKFDYQIQDFDRLVYVEYNGEQHYGPTDFANKGSDFAQSVYERTKANDLAKKQWCAKHGYPLIVVPYWIEDQRSYIESALSTQ